MYKFWSEIDYRFHCLGHTHPPKTLGNTPHKGGHIGEWQWHNGDSTRFPLMWPKFDSGPVPYVGLVFCWFSPCLKGFFFVLALQFSSAH